MNNTKKHGKPKDDIIAQMFAISYEHGEGFCKGNILKYITRYDNVAKLPFFDRIWHKLNGKGNKADLVKAYDFYIRLTRAGGLSKYFNIEEWYLSITE